MRFLLSICSSFSRNHTYWPQKNPVYNICPISFQQKSICGQFWKPCHSNGIDELINFGANWISLYIDLLVGLFEVQTKPFSLHNHCMCVLLRPFKKLLDRARLCDCQRWLALPLMPSANLLDAMFVHVTSNVQQGKNTIQPGFCMF